MRIILEIIVFNDEIYKRKLKIYLMYKLVSMLPLKFSLKLLP